MQIARAGDRALMVTLPGAAAARLRAIAEAARLTDGVLAAIVGHESVYVIGMTDADALARIAESARTSTAAPVTAHRVEVSFAPEYALDFADLLSRAGMAREAIIDRIAHLTFTVRYLGFLAGWAYLEGWPEEWALPRRPTSRNRVPGGSFAIAGAMAGIYPIDSPGGWNILGRAAALPQFEPGDEVRVVPADRTVMFVPRIPTPGKLDVELIAPGQMTTVVRERDWSRLERGEPAGGAFDVEAATIANRAAGNADDAPLFECVLVGPRLRLRQAARVAWCGASLEPRVWNARAGEEIDIGRIRDGFRGYVAVEAPHPRFADPFSASGERGYVGPSFADPFSASGERGYVGPRFADPFSASGERGYVGPPFADPFSASGERGYVGPHPSREERGSVAPRPAERGEGGRRPGEGRLTIHILRGPHHAPPLPTEWEVTPQLNRVGIRLRPLKPVDVRPPAELPSCGMQFGTLQWHPDGSIVAMGPDHPVTGGYLQPATVLTSDLWKLGQLAPGDRIRLVD